jgi:hypothetical protein
MNACETYNVNNKKYNVTFDLKFDSFYNFFESLKESKKHYNEYCETNNINIKDFDIEYIDNINILKSDLLKYYILINDDSNCDSKRYVIVNDTIKDFHNFMIKIMKAITFESRSLYSPHYIEFASVPCSFHHRDISINYEFETDELKYLGSGTILINYDHIFIYNLDIKYLSRNDLSRLIDIYSSNTTQARYFQNKSFLQNMKIDITPIKINNGKVTDGYIKSRDKYLNSLTYESIYERKLNKLLVNLPNICISNISSKKIINYSESNQQNLIDLNDDDKSEFVEVN